MSVSEEMSRTVFEEMSRHAWGLVKTDPAKMSWTSKLHYEVFVGWRELIEPDSRHVLHQKLRYGSVVSKVRLLFCDLFCTLRQYADALTIDIHGLTGGEFDEERTVNSNFRWIREKLEECNRIAEAQLLQLEDDATATFATDRLAAMVLVDAWLTTGSCRDVGVPASDGDAARDGLTNKVLICLAFRQFYALIRDDVGRLADLPDETFAKRFDYWEVPPAELIELVFRAETTVTDVEKNTDVLISRIWDIFKVSTSPWTQYTSWSLEAKAKVLEDRPRRCK